LLGSAPACAQWIVNDPANTAVNTLIQANQEANHLAILKQWATQLDNLTRQLRQLEDQLATQRRIRDVMGDPVAAGVQITRSLGAEEFAKEYGETMQAMRRLSDAIATLHSTADGIYRQLDNRTSLGKDFVRQTAPYLRYAAVEQQAKNAEAVAESTTERTAELQSELAATIALLANASTQAEVDKLNAKIATLNGQLAQLGQRRRNAADQLQAQQILNENQAAKERQDLLERQNAEERQTLDAVNAWQASLQIKPTSYRRP
jgi:outer membrane murein-binding lipoprotein Lpp